MTTLAFAPPKPVQRWSADDYARNGRFVTNLAGPLLAVLAPQKGERILDDLGCGHGVLTAYRRLLEAGGFNVETIALLPRPTPLATGIEGWLQTFGRSFFEQFAEPERSEVMTEVVAVLRPSLCAADGVWTADGCALRQCWRTEAWSRVALTTAMPH